MFTKTRILFLGVFFFIFTGLDAQEQIERLFRSDRQNTGLDVEQTSDNGYLVFSAGRHLDSLEFDFYTVTKFDDKGNLSWSTDYTFEHNIYPDGDLTLLEGDSFIISGLIDTSDQNRILLKGAPGGAVAWTRGYGLEEPNSGSGFAGFVSTDTTHRGGLFIATELFDQDAYFKTYLSEVDQDGNLLWAKTFNIDPASIVPFDVRMTPDSGAILTGRTLSAIAEQDIFILKTDSIGNVEWGRTYGEPGLAEIATAITPTPDGGFLVAGRKENPVLPSHPGLLMKTDTFGNTQWVMNVDFLTSDTVQIQDVVIAGDGNAIVSGNLLGINTEDKFAFMFKIDMDGDIIWKRRYKSSTRHKRFPRNGLLESPMGGYVHLTSSDEGIGETQVGPYLIKTDEEGMTLCDSIIDGDLIFPTTIPTDTLEVTFSNISGSKDITVVDTLNYGGFQLTTVSLETFGPYCPGEVFSDTLDATTDGAIEYEWSTGETTPTIVVTSPDDYMVTVTIGEDYCYVLCTSSSIAELPLPVINEISANAGSFCTNGIVSLGLNAENATTIEWSTGESTPSIIVDTEGTYSVTVTNQCGSDSGSVGVSFDTSAPSVSISGNDSLCTSGLEVLTAGISFPVNLISWSTGDNTQQITVGAPGTYTVTAISDFCDDGLAEYVVDPCPLQFEIGNVFTPDNDDLNDVFIPLFAFEPTQLVEYEFAIYSRWGEKVFETNNPTEGWDGTVNNEPGISDVYYYTIKGRDAEGGELQNEEGDNHGDVTLLR